MLKEATSSGKTGPHRDKSNGDITMQVYILVSSGKRRSFDPQLRRLPPIVGMDEQEMVPTDR
jgi:hypothetical protein